MLKGYAGYVRDSKDMLGAIELYQRDYTCMVILRKLGIS